MPAWVWAIFVLAAFVLGVAFMVWIYRSALDDPAYCSHPWQGAQEYEGIVWCSQCGTVLYGDEVVDQTQGEAQAGGDPGAA